MLQVAMLIFAVPIGRFLRITRQAISVFLVLVAIILFVQSIVVGDASRDGLPLAYWLVQLATLTGGVLLLWLGVALRRRHLRSYPTSPINS